MEEGCYGTGPTAPLLACSPEVVYLGFRRGLPACFGHYDADKEVATEQSPVGERRRCTVMNLRSLSLEDLSQTLATTSPHAFTLDELKSVTRNFSSANFLGEGGFDPIYKGFVDGALRPGLAAQQVAVKYLDLNSDGVQGHREWLAEAVYLGMLSHPYLVKKFSGKRS